MELSNAIDDFYKRVRAMVPEATSVSISVSRQTSTDGKGAFSMYTVIAQHGARSIAHASCFYTEDEVIADTMRQVENYRANQSALPAVCPACGTAKLPIDCCEVSDE